MLIDSLLAIGVWSATSIAGIYTAALGVKWYKFNQSAWAKSTGDSFFKYCLKKYLQPDKVRRKGYIGEVALSRQLEKVSGEKRLLFNVLIPDGPEKTTEIDALMIHETGIYVFENKNYSGKIGCYIRNSNNQPVLGNVNPYAPQWTVEYGRKARKSIFNPLLQNEKHLSCVKRLLSSHKIGLQHFFSYITFNEDANIKGTPISFQFNSEGRLLKSKHLSDELNNIIPQRAHVLSAIKIDEIANMLEPFAHVSKKKRQEHIERVNSVSRNIEINAPTEKPPLPEFRPLQDVISSTEFQENSYSKNEKSSAKNYLNLLQR